MANRLKHLCSIYILVLLLLLLFDVILLLLLSIFNSNHNSQCPYNQFRLASSNGPCYPYLNCSDVQHMIPIKLLKKSVVKNIWLVQWNHHQIVMSTLTNPDFAEDFQENSNNLHLFRTEPMVNTLLGSCGSATIFTKYQPFGDMNNLYQVYQKYRLNGFKDRIMFCIDYARILAFLHQQSMVMCDSNSLSKTLSQYLITDDLKLVINDMDALPRTTLNGGQIICGHRPIIGDFAAPEQRFVDDPPKPYDHKTDIWKIPDVCDWILANSRTSSSSFTSSMLDWIHRKCKSHDPIQRPEAKYIVKFYQLIESLHFDEK